jgi:hypothetical protein
MSLISKRSIAVESSRFSERSEAHRTVVSNDGSWVDFICWMALVELVHPQNSHQISVVPVILKCDLFKTNPGLLVTPYLVES